MGVHLLLFVRKKSIYYNTHQTTPSMVDNCTHFCMHMSQNEAKFMTTFVHICCFCRFFSSVSVG